jgi:hypothetical protein
MSMRKVLSSRAKSRDPVEKLKTPLFASNALLPGFPARNNLDLVLHGFILKPVGIIQSRSNK